MNKNKVEQENLCLETKITIDLLRTQLFQNESFSDYSIWDKRLKKLKHQIHEIYWRL